MKIKYILLSVSIFALSSCRTSLHVANVNAEKNTYITAEIPEDENFNKIIAPYKSELESKMNTVISHTSVDLTKNGDNSNLGNLLADYTFGGAESWAKQNGIPGIDAAVINIGGIRSTIGKGNILTKHIYEVMPFENEVMIVKMKGSDLQGLFDYYAKTEVNNPVSHLVIETEKGKIIRQFINGKSLDSGKTYYIATSDYLALGGDNMKFFGKGEMISTGIKMRDLFLEKFRQNSEITAPEDIRLIFRNKKNEDR